MLNLSMADMVKRTRRGAAGTRTRATSVAVAAIATGSLVCAGVALAAPAPDASCTGVLAAGTYQDVTVPAGATCSISKGDNILHDLIILKGANLVDFGASIGHDVTANAPNSLEIGGVSGGNPGTVGHDIEIVGTTGTSPTGTNYVCNQHVGHDVVVEDSASTASPWFIGDPGNNSNLFGCGNDVGHDVVAANNANPVNVSGNNPTDFENPNAGIGHDLTVTNNTAGATVNANTVGHDCTQSGDHPYSGTGNSAGHSDNCNTTY